MFKLAKSLENDYNPKKGVFVEKTSTEYCVSESAILWRKVIVVSALPFPDEAISQYVAFVHVELHMKV